MSSFEEFKKWYEQAYGAMNESIEFAARSAWHTAWDGCKEEISKQSETRKLGDPYDGDGRYRIPGGG